MPPWTFFGGPTMRLHVILGFTDTPAGKKIVYQVRVHTLFSTRHSFALFLGVVGPVELRSRSCAVLPLWSATCAPQAHGTEELALTSLACSFMSYEYSMDCRMKESHWSGGRRTTACGWRACCFTRSPRQSARSWSTTPCPSLVRKSLY